MTTPHGLAAPAPPLAPPLPTRSPRRLDARRWAVAGLAALAVLGLGLPAVAALGVGVVCGAVVGAPAGAERAGRVLLQLGVVGLGAGLDLGFVLRAGAEGFAGTVLTLGAALLGGAWLARRLGVGADVGLLISVGTAICGGSAIAAAAPAIRARGADVGVALAVVFVLNGAALLVFPLAGAALDLDPLAFGRWCAFAIHDTSSVVAAAATGGEAALEVATVTKLARALWIVPVVCVLARRRAGGAARGCPPFLLAFVAVAALVTLVPTLRPAGDAVAGWSRQVLTVALLAHGLAIRPAALRAAGPRPLLLGVALWAAVSLLSLALA